MASTKIPLELTAYAPDADGATLELQTTDTTVTDGSVLGKIEFKAPKEASGTDAILVGAAIEAVAEGTFAADNNATELVFKTGASEAAAQKMVLTSAGKLGVGNASPTEILTLGTTSDANTRIAIQSANDGSGTIQFADGTSAAAYAGYINYTHSDNALAFATASTERMRIDSSGNVGIGVTPSLGALHVKSSLTDIATFENTDSGTTGAQLLLYHNSSSPADGDRLGALAFQGKDDAGNQTTFAGIRGFADDVTNGSEQGRLTFSTTQGQNTFTEVLTIDSYGGILHAAGVSGKYMWAKHKLFTAGQTQNLDIYLNGSNLFGQIRVHMTGDYGNVDAIGSHEKVWSIGYNSVNTSNYGGGTTADIFDGGSTSNVLTFGSLSKPSNTMARIPINNTAASYNVNVYIYVEITGHIAGLDRIELS